MHFFQHAWTVSTFPRNHLNTSQFHHGYHPNKGSCTVIPWLATYTTWSCEHYCHIILFLTAKRLEFLWCRVLRANSVCDKDRYISYFPLCIYPKVEWWDANAPASSRLQPWDIHETVSHRNSGKRRPYMTSRSTHPLWRRALGCSCCARPWKRQRLESHVVWMLQGVAIQRRCRPVGTLNEAKGDCSMGDFHCSHRKNSLFWDCKSGLAASR